MTLQYESFFLTVGPECRAVRTNLLQRARSRTPQPRSAESVRIAQAEFDQHQSNVVVGSTRGGAVAMNIDSGAAQASEAANFILSFSRTPGATPEPLLV